MPLAVGSCVGRVVRIFETGFAVKFVEKQDLNDLSRLIVRHDDDDCGRLDPGGGSVMSQR